METYAVAGAAVLGLVVGSFLNVVIYRLPREESLVAPASHCAQCGRPLSALENIPVFSWLALRGRCRTCGERIAVRYPLVELLTAAIFTLAVVLHGVTIQALGLCAFGSLAVVVTFIDLDHLLIFDSVVIAALIAAVAFALLERRLGTAALGGLVFAGLLGLIYLVTRGRGLGFGDVKLGAALGAFLGYPQALWAAIGGFIMGALLAIPVLVAGRRGRRDALPFGPFIVLSSLVAAFAPSAYVMPLAAYQQFLIDHVFRR